MRIKIKHQLLSDSPYCEVNKELFGLPHASTDALVQDILNGTPTCYLVSGYRGAGKSSYINVVKEKLQALQISPKDQETSSEGTISTGSPHRDIVFIQLNFSTYHNKTYLLRKLIRALYLEINTVPKFKQIRKEELNTPNKEKHILSLEKLYEKTFYDTAHSFNDSDKNDWTFSFDIDLFKILQPLLLYISIAILCILNFFFEFLPFLNFLNVIGGITAITYGASEFINLRSSYTKSRIKVEDFNRKTLYDDEISDFHFCSILDHLKENFRIVFVLDELDKVDDEDLDKLLKELKPYLVSGNASFIAVAGQNLFYRYTNSNSIDDDVMSSIFSRLIHVSLFSRGELRILFNKLIVETSPHSEKQMDLIDSYIDHLVFESKKVPRKFVSLIRQNLIWEDNQSYLDIDESPNIYKSYTTVLDIIDEIDDKEICTVGYPDATRDYLLMNLLLISHRTFSTLNPMFTKQEMCK